MLTDPIADMLTRIRNANRALHDSASMPTSRMKEEIARILKDEGYIKDFRVVECHGRQGAAAPVPHARRRAEVRARSAPRHHRPQARLQAGPPRLRAARIASRACSAGSAPPSCPPPTGVITNRQAAERGVGGEVIAFVW